MENENVNVAEPMSTEMVGQEGGTLPTNISVWTKIKNFLFQEITVELTPKQEKVFKEVNDFWHQEVNKDFWFQKIDITL